MKLLSKSSLLILSLTLLCLSSRILAQESETKQVTVVPPLQTNAVSTAEVETQLAALDAVTDADEASVTMAKELYAKSKTQIQSAQEFSKQAAAMSEKAAQAPGTLESIKEQLAKKTNNNPIRPKTLSQAELQNELTQKKAALKGLREELARLSSEPSRRQSRQLELPKLIGEKKEKITVAEGQLAQIDETSSPVVAKAKNTELRATIHSLKAELQALEAEVAFYAATAELVPLQTQLAEREIQSTEAEVTAWQEAIAEIRVDKVDELQRQAKKLAKDVAARLEPAAAFNLALVDRYSRVSERLAEINQKLNNSQTNLKRVQADFQTSKERVDAVGLNDILGMMLRRSKSELNSLRRNHLPNTDASLSVGQLQVELFEIQDLFANAAVTDSSIATLFAEHDVVDANNDSLIEDAKEILSQRREILLPLTESQSELFNLTLELDTTNRLLVAEADAYTNYINEHILWIRSGPVLGTSGITPISKAFRWTFLPEHWIGLVQALLTGAQRKLGLLIFVSVFFVALVLLHNRFSLNLVHASAIARPGNCVVFLPTLSAASYTFLMSIKWPFLVGVIGLLITRSSNLVFVQACSQALITVALSVFPLEFVRQACRNDGLIEDHFEWPDVMRKFLRANLRWFNPTLTVFLFFACLLQYQPDDAIRNTLGRLVMIFLLLVWAFYLYKVLHPASALYQGASKSDQANHWHQLRVVRFVVILTVVAALLVFTIAGYFYSTWQIGSRLIQTHALLIGFVYCYEMAMRWLLVRRRRLKLDQLEMRRAETKKDAVDQAGGDTIQIDVRTDLGIDANHVSKQTSQLLVIAMSGIGLWVAWWIWADLVPAIGILNRINLWRVSIGGVDEWVTLQHVAFFFVTIAGTIVAVKNLPGILELMLVKQLPLDAGSRYAVSTIARYLVTLIGIVIASAFLKIQWSQFSWLLAAISVGLGFGLQEIVANFVSGLILLLERPVRIGDVVTIEGTTGVVSRIQMRATTVTNWDQQELVVPNKNLITNSIFNWTLSNVLTRITIEVGVTYEADPREVQRLVLEVVQAHPEVLNEPAPSVVFQTFGDSSLNFVARCCISGPDKRLSTIHALHVAIHEKLAEQGIEIPYPQRDVHMITDQANAKQDG